MADEILTEIRENGAVAVITLNRPERHNALTLAMWQGLAAHVRAFGENRAIRVIVIRGAGERAFASGADLHELATHRQTPEGAAAYHAAVEDTFTALATVEQPVIAMIHGYCIGGGCELAVACDLRVADERARVGIPAARLGIVLGVDELRRLTNLVGVAAAKEILFTARQLDAEEALRVGLINEIAPSADLDRTVMQLARQIVDNAPLAIGALKTLLNAVAGDMPENDVRALQRGLLERTNLSGESRERIDAFVNRRSSSRTDSSS